MKRMLALLPDPLAAPYRSRLEELRARGVLVIAGESPSAAISLAQVWRPDLFVVGLSTRGISGLEMVVVLQQQHGLAMPIVVLPDPGDPLDPFICTCEPGSGMSHIEHHPLGQIWIRIAKLLGLGI